MKLFFVLITIFALTLPLQLLSQDSHIGSLSYLLSGWVKIQNDARPLRDTNAYSQPLLKGDRVFVTDGFIELVRIDPVYGYLVETIEASVSSQLTPIFYDLKLENIKIDGGITASDLIGRNFGCYAPRKTQFFLSPKIFKNGRLHPKFIAYKKRLIADLADEKNRHINEINNLAVQYKNDLKEEHSRYKNNQNNTRAMLKRM